MTHPTLLALIAVLAPTAVVGPIARTPAHPSLPWLYNLEDVRAVETGDRLVTLSMTSDPDPSCRDNASPGLVLVADVAPAAGVETIFASYTNGIMVVGREGEPIASTSGYPCAGSADEVEVLATGTAFGKPTIVLAVTTGGRREQLTWVGLFQLGHHGRLEPVFAGAVEQREDGIVRRGSVTILPGALLVRDPFGAVGFWTFDDEGGVYVPRGGYGSTVPHS